MLRLFFIYLLFLLTFSCTEVSQESDKKDSDGSKEILTFGINDTSGLISGSISGTNITVYVPILTKITALTADFTTSGKSVKCGSKNQTSGVTVNDFSRPLDYTVTAEDNSTKNYTVTVLRKKPVYSETAPTNTKYYQVPMEIHDNGATTTQTHRFHFDAPDIYNSDKTKTYPLVINLHASGFPNSEEATEITEESHFAYLRDGSSYAYLGGKDIPESFYYVPICPPPYSSSTGGPLASDGGEWNSPAAKQMIMATIKDLISRFNIDIDRIYINGFSMGGAGTWYIAQEWYDETGIPFAAICRGAGYSPTNQTLDNGKFGDIYRSAVWIDVGNNDTMGIRGSMGNNELMQYTYNKQKTQRPGGSETHTTRTLSNPDTNSDTKTIQSEFYDYTVNGESIYRLSVNTGWGHSYFIDWNPDFITWLFSKKAHY